MKIEAFLLAFKEENKALFLEYMQHLNKEFPITFKQLASIDGERLDLIMLTIADFLESKHYSIRCSDWGYAIALTDKHHLYEAVVRCKGDIVKECVLKEPSKLIYNITNAIMDTIKFETCPY